jgi:hypothetical protein
VEQANHNLRDKVAKLDDVITNFRNEVTLDKLERDAIRTENKEWKVSCGSTAKINEKLKVDHNGHHHHYEEDKTKEDS